MKRHEMTTRSKSQVKNEEKNTAAPAITAIAELNPIEREILEHKLATARAERAAAELNLSRARTPVETIDDEIKDVQLQTARLDLLRAKEANDAFISKREELIRKREEAVKTIASEAALKAAAHAACKHRVGGFKDDKYKGGQNAQSSVLCTMLPMIGHKLYLCYRCFDEVATPDRNLLQGSDEDKARYAEQLEKFTKFEELFDNSYNAQIMGCPQFQFEKNGLAIHPAII